MGEENTRCEPASVTDICRYCGVYADILKSRVNAKSSKSFVKPKNVNCTILFFSKKLPLRIIYANEVNIYYLQHNMR